MFVVSNFMFNNCVVRPLAKARTARALDHARLKFFHLKFSHLKYSQLPSGGVVAGARR